MTTRISEWTKNWDPGPAPTIWLKKMKFPTDPKNNSYAKITSYNSTVDGTITETQNIEPHAVNHKGEVKRRGRGSDDSIFESCPHLHRVFPRGMSITSLTDAKGEKEDHILRGFFKFSGLSQKDEDDSTPL